MEERNSRSVEDLLAEGDNARRNKDIDGARLKYAEALKKGKVCNYHLGIAKALTGLGLVYRSLDQLGVAADNFSQAFAIAREINNYELCATSINDLFLVKVLCKDHSDLEEIFQSALDLFVTAKDIGRVGTLMVNYSRFLGENRNSRKRRMP